MKKILLPNKLIIVRIVCSFALIWISTVSVFAQITPTISSFSPQSGSISTTVSIVGSNFNTNPLSNAVFFGATQANVLQASTGMLTVTVPTGASYQYISVTNLATNLTAYSASPFVVTFPSNGITDFISDPVLTTPTSPYGLTLGDFNGDGKPDLVVASSGNSKVSVYRNISTSAGVLSFTLAIDLAISSTRSVGSTLADFDGDGKLDLAVSEYTTSILQVFRNTTVVGSNSFTFSSGFNLTTAGGAYWISSGDLDGDGRIDIVSGNADAGIRNVVSVFRNVSVSGTLNFNSKQDIIAGQDPIFVAIGDLDKDSKPDIVASNKFSNTVSIFRNISTTATISFTEAVTLTGLNLPHGVVIADFDGDTNPDLAVANWGSGSGNTVSFFRNANTVTGTLSFTPTANLTFVTGNGPVILSAGDVDGDGKVDLGIECSSSSILAVLKNRSTIGSLSFTNRVNYSISAGSENLVIGDMNGDGKPDIAVSGNTISLFRNTTINPLLISSFTPINGPVSTSVTITGSNFNATANQNVVFFGATRAAVTGATTTSLTVIVPYGANYQYISVTDLSTNLTVYSAQPFVVTYPTPLGGFNDFAPELAFSITSQPLAHAVADFDGDNKPDIIVGSNTAGVVTLMLNRTTPGSSSISYTITTFTIPSVYNAVVGIAAVDYDGDGKLDLAMSDSVAPERVYLYRNISTIGTLSFTANPTIALSSGTGNSFGVAAGDLDNDGRPDLAFVTDGTAQIAVCRNLSVSGSIMFSTQTNFAIPSGSYTVAMGDMDGDGKLDMIAALASTANVAVLRNTSSGVGNISFASALNLTNGSNTSYSVALGDFNGDNKLDIVAGNFNASSISVYRNLSTSGALSFTTAQTFATGSDRRGVAVGDVDGDSMPDVVSFGNGASGYNISVLKNATTSSTNINFASAMDYKSAYVNTVGSSQPGRVSLVDLNLDGLSCPEKS